MTHWFSNWFNTSKQYPLNPLRGLLFGLFSMSVASLMLTSCMETPPVSPALRLYQEAWQAIRTDYMDSEFNGQNWKTWQHRYDQLIKTQDDAHVAIETMLASLNDPYTRLLKPRNMQEETMFIDAKMYGVGMQISIKDNQLVVVVPMPNTPAEKAGILAGDEVMTVNGKPTAGLSIEEAADMIRGPKGTPVRLEVVRGGKKRIFNMIRDEIKLESVSAKRLDQDKRIGYLQLNSFISQDEMSEVLAALKKLDHPEALIIDLRGNFGGLLSNAVSLSDLFLAKGIIVQVDGQRNEDNQTYEAYASNKVEEARYEKLPLVVLIDKSSASASEIMCGALKENNRATLVGEATFGKGLVQKIEALSDGSGIHVTISRYLTPLGHDINKKGVTPNITVPFNVQAFLNHGTDVQLEAAIQQLKQQLNVKTASR